MPWSDDGISIRRSRLAMLLPGVASILFVLIGLWLFVSGAAALDRPRSVVMLYAVVTIALFGWIATASILSLIKPGQLRLDADGYWFDGWLRGRKTGWGDVVEFRLVRIGITSGVEPVLTGTGNRSRQSEWRSRMLCFLVDGSQFSGLIQRPKALHATLETWRKRHG